MKNKLINTFNDVFGLSDKLQTFFAPGRVNLIGEHIDYNGGCVLPCALSIGTYGVFRKRSDKTIRFYSLNFEDCGIITGSVDKLDFDESTMWTNYPMSVVWSYIKHGYKIDSGFDVLVYGNIPNSSGLSSSASIEVLTAFALKDMFSLDISMVDIALLCQYAENNYIGVKCGIMDQFAIAMGKENHAIYLDTNTLRYEYVPLNLDNVKIVIANTNKQRELAASKYNERRLECERALQDLRKAIAIKSLCELNLEKLEANKQIIINETDYRRARHAASENERAIKAVKILSNNNIKEFGRLMNESHISLRYDYEVSCLELDTLVEEALKCEGVLGSRMTGAGFGGCTVTLVEDKYVDEFIKKVGGEYQRKTNYTADFYTVTVGAGPRIL